MIRKFFNTKELLQLVTSNFYSILYYNCEIWLSQDLKVRSKQQLLAASANALKLLNNVSDLRTSYNNLHNLEKRATPMNFAKYRLAIQLHKIYNDLSSSEDWRDMNFQQNFNNRIQMFNLMFIRLGKIYRLTD